MPKSIPVVYLKTDRIPQGGTGEIVKLCLQHGLKKPLFEQDGDFKVIIWRPVPQDVLEDAIIAAIRANPKVSREEIAKKVHVSSKTIARKMNKMRDKIRFVGRGYSGHWEVVEE